LWLCLQPLIFNKVLLQPLLLPLHLLHLTFKFNLGPAVSSITNAAPLVMNSNPTPPTNIIVPVTANPVPPTNAVSTTGGKWFTVTRGHQVGVFHSWFMIIWCRALLVFIACYRLTVAPLVNGVPGSVYNKHPSEAAAQVAFDKATAAGNVHPYVA
jgi:hypothetical protein